MEDRDLRIRVYERCAVARAASGERESYVSPNVVLLERYGATTLDLPGLLRVYDEHVQKKSDLLRPLGMTYMAEHGCRAGDRDTTTVPCMSAGFYVERLDLKGLVTAFGRVTADAGDVCFIAEITNGVRPAVLL